MRIQRWAMAGLAAGAVALAVAGCSRTAQGAGEGQGYRGGRDAAAYEGQGYRGGRDAAAYEGQGYRGGGSAAAVDAGRQLAQGYGRGRQESLTATDTRGQGRLAVEPASERRGRDVADVGTLRSLVGELQSDGTEWYLATADGRYLLHLGNTGYVERIGLRLEAGDTAEVRGLVDATEVSVVSIDVGGTRYTLRTEDGRPLWAGNGRGGGRGGRAG